MQTLEVWYAEVSHNQYALMSDERDTLPPDATYVKQIWLDSEYIPGMTVAAYAESIAAMNPGWVIEVDGWGRHSEHGPYLA